MTSDSLENASNACLPYWNSDLDIEVGNWAFSSRKIFPPANLGFFDGILDRLSMCALAFESELLYYNGSLLGVGGSMTLNDTLYVEGFDTAELLPLTIIFGYSSQLERFLARMPEFSQNDSEDDPENEQGRVLRPCIAQCTFRRSGVPLLSYKTITFLAKRIMIDEAASLTSLCRAMENYGQGSELSYYASHFGYLRAPIMYETDRVIDLLIEKQLDGLQLDAAHAVVGASPYVSIPDVFDSEPAFE